MGASPVSHGGTLSPKYRAVAAALAERDMTPAEYIGQLRDEGYGWGRIAQVLADEAGIGVPLTSTVKFWRHTTPGCSLTE